MASGGYESAPAAPAQPSSSTGGYGGEDDVHDPPSRNTYLAKGKTMLTKTRTKLANLVAPEDNGPVNIEGLRDGYDRAIGELRKKCGRTKYADTLLFNISTMAHYVDTLQSSHAQLAKRYDGAVSTLSERNTALYGIGDKIQVEMRKLDPSILADVSKTTPAPPQMLLDVLLEGYARNQGSISTLTYQFHQAEKERSNIQRHLDDERGFHKSRLVKQQQIHARELNDMRQTHINEVRELQQRQINELDNVQQTRLNELGFARRERENAEHQHRLEIQELNTVQAGQTASLHSEINSLKSLHDSKLANLIADYESQLNTQKVISDKEKAALRKALTSGDRFQPMADQVLSSRFKDLILLVSKLAGEPFRHKEINGQRLEEFGRQEGLQQWVPREGHRFVVENMIWGNLAAGCFRSPFGVLGGVGEEMGGMWSQLFRRGRSPGYLQHQPPISECPPPDDLSERWRHTTLEALRRSLSSPTSQAKASHATHLSILTKTLVTTLSSISLQDHTPDIQNIVNGASSLALDFGIQRYRLEIFGAGENEEVEMGEMFEDLNDLTWVKGARGRVLFVISPGLKRLGGTRGGSWEQGKVIIPAGVYLRTDG
ncbi:MAG: hypothetical protein M1840_007889 [Geoglossum simile]|nr:MAG: hypothetical protein M1840_007889 [Geoglossum simile]